MTEPAAPALRRLARDEGGAVTVDWVVLTAFLVGLAVAVVGIVVTAANDPAEGVGAQLSGFDPIE